MTEIQKLTIGEATSAFTPLVGQYAWWIRCTDYRVLQVEFGDPHLRVQGPWSVEPLEAERPRSVANRRLVLPTGTWSLFVEHGLWTVDALGLTCSRSLSTQDEIDLCLSRLDGQRLTSARIKDRSSILHLEFDLEASLSVALSPDLDDDDQWTLFRHRGPSISYQTSGDIEVESSDHAMD